MLGWMLLTATASCPIEGLVAARLGPNVPFRYQVELNGPTLAIRFFDEERPVERSFAAAPSCDENVQVASAVLSAWMISPPVQHRAVPAPHPALPPPSKGSASPKEAARPPSATRSLERAAAIPAPSRNDPAARQPAVVIPRKETAPGATPAIPPNEVAAQRPATPVPTPPIPPPSANEVAARGPAVIPVPTPPAPPPPSRNESALLERTATNGPAPGPLAASTPLSPPPNPPALGDAPSAPNPSTSSVPTAQDKAAAPVTSNALSVSVEGGASASSGSATNPSQSASSLIAAAGAARLTYGATVGGFLELDGTTPRTFSLGVGEVSWARLSGGAGVRLRILEVGRFALEPAVSIHVAALPVSGSGFRSSATALVPDLGGCANVRAGLRAAGDLEVFLSLRGCAWPVTPNVRVAGLELTASLPSAEASVRLGVSYGWKL